MRHVLKRQEPKLLLDIPEIIELACTAHWNCGLYPGQYEWDRLVENEDHRIPGLRLAMKAALSAAVAAGLATMEFYHDAL